MVRGLHHFLWRGVGVERGLSGYVPPMSIWEYMKPAQAGPEPTRLELVGNVLAVGWSDGGAAELPARLLRQQCPCAACVDEWSHKRTLAPESVPAEIGIREVRPVGNYAAQLAFSDGHETGIFTWKLLRELGAQAALGVK
jgi:DUF971 family protein